MIKPVEFQVMISKTLDVAKVHYEENQKEIALRYQQAASTQQKVENSLKQVYSRAEAEYVRINERQRDNNNNSEKKKKNKQNTEKNEGQDKNGLNSGIKTSKIDIKI